MKYNCCEKYLPSFSAHRCTVLYIWYNFEFISVLNKQKCYYLSEASEIAHLESYEKCRLRNDNVWRGACQLFNWILTPQQQHLQKGYYNLGEDFQKEKLEKFPIWYMIAMNTNHIWSVSFQRTLCMISDHGRFFTVHAWQWWSSLWNTVDHRWPLLIGASYHAWSVVIMLWKTGEWWS